MCWERGREVGLKIEKSDSDLREREREREREDKLIKCVVQVLQVATVSSYI